MAKKLQITGQVKLITSGNAPTVENLKKGELAFGEVGGRKRLYGSDGTAVYEINPSEVSAAVQQAIDAAVAAAKTELGNHTINGKKLSENPVIGLSDIRGTKGVLDGTLEEILTRIDSTASMAQSDAIDNAAEITKLKASVAAVYRPKGSKPTLAEVLALTDSQVGDVWNVGAAFTLNGKEYAAETNVACITASEAGKATAEAAWDALGGTFDVSDLQTSIAANTQKATENKQALDTLKSDFDGLTVELVTSEIWPPRRRLPLAAVAAVVETI